MARKKRYKAKAQRQAVQVAAPQMNWGLDAARYDEAWPVNYWQTLRPNDEVNMGDLRTIWQRARMLFHNNDSVRSLVLNMVQLTGVQNPLPITEDEEWNQLALDYFLTRTREADLFDAAGAVNFWQAQAYAEQRAIVDGDVLMVATYAPDGGAAFAFVEAPRIAGGSVNGVDVDPFGRAVTYHVMGEDGVERVLPATGCVLYRHHVSPSSVRGHSELVSTLRTGNDLREILGYNKRAVKLSSSFGLVMTKSKDDTAPQFGSGVGPGARKGAAPAAAEPAAPRTLTGTGLEITALPPGRELKTITDGRPSPQVMEFVKYLTESSGGSVGLSGATVFNSAKLGSAAVRFELDKFKLWVQPRLQDRERLLDRIWRHTIACAIAAGHLRPCKDARWHRVRWIPGRDLTIDRGREAASTINLIRENLADQDAWCLSTSGRTYKQLVRRKAENIAYTKAVAAEFGLSYAELHEGVVGAAPAEPAPQENEDILTQENQHNEQEEK